ncbi:MAG: undecaprenyl-diphosphate phosphatase [Christensenellaceae bacterium]
MNILQSIILGIVQGFTEFLPVSSSGHLVLFQNIFGITEVPLFYDIMLHVGTLVAVVIVLWVEIKGLICHPVKNKLGMLILATVPAVVATLFLGDFFVDAYSGQYLAYGFFGTAIILTVSELIARRIEAKKSHVALPSAMVMGVMQAVAILPGVSRSGSTISGGLFMGIDRTKAARFAFLMSIPAILGSVVFGAKDVVENGMGDVSILSVVIGTIVAAVCGFLAIKFMLNMISKMKLYGFAIYVAVLGAFVLLDQTVFHLIFA